MPDMHDPDISLNDICRLKGDILFADNQFEEAFEMYLIAIELNPDDNISKENSEYCLHHMLPAWHFRMLNDNLRNSKYLEALRVVVKKMMKDNLNIHAIEIGCGTGLLTMMALQAGCTNIVACDNSSFFTGITHSVLNNSTQESSNPNVSVLTTDSYHLQVNSKFNLLFAELFDCSLLGEHFLSVLLDLHQRNIIHDNCTIIPKSASVHIGLYESIHLRKSNYWSSDGFTLRRATYNASYTCYTLNNISAVGDLILLARKDNIVKIDFTDLEQIEYILSGQWKQHIQLNAFPTLNDRGYMIDFAAIWFSLDLCDGISISTGTEKEDCACWQQAVYPITQPFYMNDVVQCEVNCNTNDEHRDEYLNINFPNSFISSLDKEFFVNSASILRMHRNDYQLAYLNEYICNMHTIVITDSILKLFFTAESNTFVLCSQSTPAYQLLQSKNLPLSVIDESQEKWIDEFANVIYEPCDQTGQIQRNLWQNMNILNSNINSIIPHSFQIIGFLAECSHIREEVSVNDEISDQFSINQELNNFSPRRVYDIDCSVCSFTRLSDEIELIHSNQFKYQSEEKSIEFIVNSDGSFDIMLYFFRLHMSNVSIDTLLPMNSSSSGFRLAGLRNPGKSIRVCQDQTVICKLQRHDHYLEALFEIGRTDESK